MWGWGGKGRGGGEGRRGSEGVIDVVLFWVVGFVLVGEMR